MRALTLAAIVLALGGGSAMAQTTPDEVFACSSKDRFTAIMEAAESKLEIAMRVAVAKRECALIPGGKPYAVTEKAAFGSPFLRIRLRGEVDQWWAMEVELQKK